MSTRTIDISKQPPDLESILPIVAEGTLVILTKGDTPIARIAPAGKRIAGLNEGASWMSEDFDEPLPDDFWLGDS